jgi:hypothetical protein
MPDAVEIENIDEMRRRVGVDDVELRDEIRGLRAGDLVKITLLSGTKPPASETLPVRITSVSGSSFRGELAKRPAAAGLSGVRAGSPVAFTAAHIHSIVKRRRPCEQ